MQRIVFFTLSVLIYSTSEAQYSEYKREMYFNRQPSARAEAMGRGFASIDGDLTASFFNPAGIASIRVIESNVSFAKSNYNLDSTKYTYFNLGFRINQYLTLSFSNFTNICKQRYFNVFENNHYTKNYLNDKLTTLTIASEPLKNLYIGLNINDINVECYQDRRQTKYLDFGLIKKFEFDSLKRFKHSINIGASVTNFTNTKANDLDVNIPIKHSLPVISRYGLSYRMSYQNPTLLSNLKTFQLLAQCDYNQILNYKFRNGIHTGIEFTIFEMLVLRGGYFNEKIDDYGYGYEALKLNYYKGFTYGFGLQIPLSKLTKMPIFISLDFINQKQLYYSISMFQKDNYGNFHTINLKINWTLDLIEKIKKSKQIVPEIP